MQVGIYTLNTANIEEGFLKGMIMIWGCNEYSGFCSPDQLADIIQAASRTSQAWTSFLERGNTFARGEAIDLGASPFPDGRDKGR